MSSEKLIVNSGLLEYFAPVQVEVSRLHGLREQAAKDSPDDPYLCISDFVAPKSSSKADYIGLFAVTAGLDLERLLERFKMPAYDDYRTILAKSLADRLAEAFAEQLHARVRRELWGYSSEETLSDAADYFRLAYCGIRPAPGYPSQPDHKEQLTVWNLLLPDHVGISLSENFAMMPAASVCGVYFAHPHSRYFQVGKIQRDQVADYAKRCNESVHDIESRLGLNLAYEYDRNDL